MWDHIFTFMWSSYDLSGTSTTHIEKLEDDTWGKLTYSVNSLTPATKHE